MSFWNVVRSSISGNGHISGQARSEMSNTDYASTLNGLTSSQLKQEKTALQNQMKWTAPQNRCEIQQKLDLVNKELQSRGSGCQNVYEDMSRTVTQSQYKNTSTADLQTQLAELYQQRTDEKKLAGDARALGFKGTSQFDSNYDKDSATEKQIGAIEAELTKRGEPLEKPKSLMDIISSIFGKSGASSSSPAPEKSFETQRKDAVDQIYKHFSLLDTAAGRGGRDNKVSEKDLKAALNNPSLPKELKDAIRFLFDNRAVYNQLDVGAGRGKIDGTISLDDIQKVRARL